MLIVRGTKKLRDRVKAPAAGEHDTSTTALGDWFATALFWRPHVALLVNTTTFVPVVMELAPAATLLDRVPAAIAAVLARHGVPERFLDAELRAMAETRLGPTNDRSVLGVMNELAFLGQHHLEAGIGDLELLSLRLADVPLGPLRKRHGFPDRELAAFVGGLGPLAEVIPLRPGGGTAAAPPARSAGGSVFQLKVTLHGTKPPIWRRVLVDGASTLDHLHEVIQAAFGWWNCHLHEFEIGRRRFGVPDPDDDWGEPTSDESDVRLDAVAEEGTKFEYVYDFGDWWRHLVVVEKVTPSDGTTTVPACLEGRRAGPPEDCGGVDGYAHLLEILADPGHPEHADRAEWAGGALDPAAFDPADFDDNLRALRLTAVDDET